jgi:hypothetical protein
MKKWSLFASFVEILFEAENISGKEELSSYLNVYTVDLNGKGLNER